MTGSTQFPAALDTFPEIGPNTSEAAAGVEHDVVHENVHAAVAALQVKVGIDASANPASVDARLAEAASDIDLLADAQLAHQADADPHPQYLTDAEVDARIAAQKGVALGIVPLNSATQIDTTYLPASVLGQVEYKGTWNATGAAPTAAPEKGWYYVVVVSGATNLSGITDWKVGDWAIYSGTAWDKVDNTDAIASWNGRTGAVVPLAGDYTAEQVGAQPTIADSGWLAPMLENGWVNFGAGYSVAAYRKIGQRVILRGMIKDGAVTDGTVIFTLPAGYRPPGLERFRPSSSIASAERIVISTSGAVSIFGVAAGSNLGVSGIDFFVD